MFSFFDLCLCTPIHWLHINRPSWPRWSVSSHRYVRTLSHPFTSLTRISPHSFVGFRTLVIVLSMLSQKMLWIPICGYGENRLDEHYLTHVDDTHLAQVQSLSLSLPPSLLSFSISLTHTISRITRHERSSLSLFRPLSLSQERYVKSFFRTCARIHVGLGPRILHVCVAIIIGLPLLAHLDQAARRFVTIFKS